MLIGAVPPLMLKTPANLRGLSIEVFDQIRAGTTAPTILTKVQSILLRSNINFLQGYQSPNPVSHYLKLYCLG